MTTVALSPSGAVTSGPETLPPRPGSFVRYLRAVSYTHLDVYKRQDLDIGMKAPVPDLEDADLEIVALPSLRAWNSPRSRSTRRPGPISSAW